MIKNVCILLLLGLLSILSYQLAHTRTDSSSGLIGEPVPTFRLTNLLTHAIWTEQTLIGQVSLVNIWATWCSACELEHPMLLKISHDYGIPVYGIAYKDHPNAVKAWLQQHGNPFWIVSDDQEGSTAIDFGIYGTPETFIINKQGYIVYRHMGIIDQHTWDTVLYPLILKYQQQS